MQIYFLNLFCFRTSPSENIFITDRSNAYKFEHIYELDNRGPSVLQRGVMVLLAPELVKDSKVVLRLITARVI